MNDKTVFDSGFRIISDYGEDDLTPHFIYCGMHYFWNDEDQLRSLFLDKMKSYGVRTAILTMLNMWRRNLEYMKENSKMNIIGRTKNPLMMIWRIFSSILKIMQ